MQSHIQRGITQLTIRSRMAVSEQFGGFTRGKPHLCQYVRQAQLIQMFHDGLVAPADGAELGKARKQVAVLEAIGLVADIESADVEEGIASHCKVLR